jgi:hypothetical protein
MARSSSSSVARRFSMSKVPPELRQPLGAASQLTLPFHVCHARKISRK